MENRNRKVDNARQVLGLPRDATAEDAREKYRALAKTWHPDINPDENAHIRMQEINLAYAFLMKEEFGILDVWGEYDKWWWRQYGNDPIWGSSFSEEKEQPETSRQHKKLPRGN